MFLLNITVISHGKQHHVLLNKCKCFNHTKEWSLEAWPLDGSRVTRLNSLPCLPEIKQKKKKSSLLSLFDDVVNRSEWPWAVWHVGRRGSVLTTIMMNLSALVHSLRCSLLHIESRLVQAAGLTLDRQLGELTDWLTGPQEIAADLILVTSSD